MIMFCLYTFFTKFYFIGLLILLFIISDIKKLNYFVKTLIHRNYLVFSIYGVQIDFKLENLIKWEEIENYEIDPDLRKMTILLKNSQSIEIELWRLKIRNYNLFKRTVDTFAIRYQDSKKK